MNTSYTRDGWECRGPVATELFFFQRFSRGGVHLFLHQQLGAGGRSLLVALARRLEGDAGQEEHCRNDANRNPNLPSRNQSALTDRRERGESTAT